MTVRLVPGQNLALSQSTVTASARVPSVDVCALLVDDKRRVRGDDDFVFWNQPTATGVRLGENGTLALTLDDVDPGVDAVLFVVAVDGHGSLPPQVDLSLEDSVGVPIVEFAPSTTGLAALVGFEVYRRGSGWKIRAVGQGYAGGLADLLTAHGVDVDAPDSVDPEPVSVPLDRSRVLERMWMIFEDASRSAAAFDAAVDYADERLEEELSEVAADAAARTSPAGDRARSQAQDRHDTLVASAHARHLTDSRQLTAELTSLDSELPAGVASWTSPAWGNLDGSLAECIRVGEVSVPERGPLRVPLCAAWPAANPLWFDDETGGHASSGAITATLLRIAASAPRGATTIEILDMGGALADTSARLSPLASTLTDRASVAARLDQLVHGIDLWHMAVGAGEEPPPRPPRTAVVLSGFPYGFGPDELARIAFLADGGPVAGLSLVIVGSIDPDSPDPIAAGLLRRSMHLPLDGQSPVFDPWVKGEWLFEADTAPEDPRRIEAVVRELANHE